MTDDKPFIISIIQDLANVSHVVNSYFKDEEKTQRWLNSDNPLLGDVSPVEMIFAGRTEKLLDFVKTSLDDNGI